MTEMEIQDQIRAFDRWHYRFNLKGLRTPVLPGKHNRHRQRKHYFFYPLLKLFGGDLKGKRVLDLGCNAGYWSYLAAKAGCDYVLGIDGRSMHVQQSKFVFNIKDIDEHRYDFIEGNIFETDFSRYGGFDVVLCLGLLYHVSKPMELMEIISNVNSDVLVLDTNVSLYNEPVFRMGMESTDDPRNAVDYESVLVPSKSAVVAMGKQFGYDVKILRPVFSDWSGADEYRDGYRKSFLCAKQTPLDSLRVPVEPPEVDPGLLSQ